jgi:toxin-antitoxin system PIN domain toxin
MRALLDVNVLIALLDAAHVHHKLATAWLGANIRQGWASCPVTQIGCVRVMAQPAYPNARPAAQVAERLRDAAADRHHEFWPADLDLLNSRVIDWSYVLTSRHVTDVYLLGLAVAKGGRFVTFDRHIPRAALAKAEARNLVVIGAG